MLHFLTWIFLFLKDIRWQGELDKKDGDSPDINPGKINVKVEMLPNGGKGLIYEEITESNILDAEQSLDDILNDTSWKAVDGSLQTEAFINEEKATEVLFSANPSYDGIGEIDTEAGKGRSKVQRVKSFVESVGDVADGDTVKNATIIKRADSFKNKEKGRFITKHERGQQTLTDEPIIEAKNSYGESAMHSGEHVVDGTPREASNNAGYISDLIGNMLQKKEEISTDNGYGKVSNTGSGDAPLKSRYTSKKDVTLTKTFDRNVNNLNGQSGKRAVYNNYEATVKVAPGNVGSVVSSDTADRCSEDHKRSRSDSWDSLDLKLSCNLEGGERHQMETVVTGTGVQEEENAKAEDRAVGKLKIFSKKAMSPVHNESPKAEFQDFDVIMRRRKLHTDTMQKVSDTFGDFGHREDKHLCQLDDCSATNLCAKELST
eukprot:gene7642-13461_t